nr:unnamed protein product [Callosobruchus analis]
MTLLKAVKDLGFSMINNMNSVKQAGVIETPKLLMRSGVGPRKHLKKVGIAPRINLPVGKNLQDHITTGFDLVEALGRRLVVNWSVS